jgi:hypothetical protein
MTYLSSRYIEAQRAQMAQIVIRWHYYDALDQIEQTLDLHPGYLSFTVARGAPAQAATPANSRDQYVLAGPKEGQAHYTCYADLQREYALSEGTKGLLIYGREGDLAGAPKRSFPALITTFSEILTHDGAPTFSVIFTKTGPLVMEEW